MRYKLNKLNVILNILFRFEINDKEIEKEVKLIYLILVIYIN